MSRKRQRASSGGRAASLWFPDGFSHGSDSFLLSVVSSQLFYISASQFFFVWKRPVVRAGEDGFLLWDVSLRCFQKDKEQMNICDQQENTTNIFCYKPAAISFCQENKRKFVHVWVSHWVLEADKSMKYEELKRHNSFCGFKGLQQTNGVLLSDRKQSAEWC